MSFNCIYSNTKMVFVGADSREIFANHTYNDNNQKVFTNDALHLIWSMTGVTRYNNIHYFHIINEIMNTEEASIEEKINSIQLLMNPITEKIHRETSRDVYFDMFIATLLDDTIVCYTIESKNGMNPKLTNVYNWGYYMEVSGTHLEHKINISEKELDAISDEDMIAKINQSIRNAIKSSKNDEYPSIGGDIYIATMDNKGNIKTYINGKEKNFSK